MACDIRSVYKELRRIPNSELSYFSVSEVRVFPSTRYPWEMPLGSWTLIGRWRSCFFFLIIRGSRRTARLRVQLEKGLLQSFAPPLFWDKGATAVCLELGLGDTDLKRYRDITWCSNDINDDIKMLLFNTVFFFPPDYKSRHTAYGPVNINIDPGKL